jgi:hypothetical protein
VELAVWSYRKVEGLLSRRDDSEHVRRCGEVNLHPFVVMSRHSSSGELGSEAGNDRSTESIV